MQILIDTNVVLDVLLNRPDFVVNAVNILKLPGDAVQKYVSASAITDIYYIARRELKDKEMVRKLLKSLLSVIHVANVTEVNILDAVNSDWSDFEDSVQNSVAESNQISVIITRNKNDYKKSLLKVLSPEEFLNELMN